jgi:hypothetical protein
MITNSYLIGNKESISNKQCPSDWRHKVKGKFQYYNYDLLPLSLWAQFTQQKAPRKVAWWEKCS